MNYSKLIKDEFDKKEIDLEVNEIPLNIFLKEDEIPLCFIERETIDALVIYQTTSKLEDNDVLFSDELRIIPKDKIEYVAIVYDLDFDFNEKTEDKMFL